jgi:hypothetical protein
MRAPGTPSRDSGTQTFVPFLYELRRRKVPVGTQEAVALARALAAGLHESSLDGFYQVARALCVHSEVHLDAFDEAFLAVFRGIEKRAFEIKDELLEWLREAALARDLTAEERAMLEDLDPEELKRRFEELLREQNERHDGGNRFIGTGGTSPFGHSGAPRAGFRVGGAGGNKSAIRVADARRYRPYRSDVLLDTRSIEVALRKLRAFTRDGPDDELDLDGTIDATARNAGEIEVVTRPPRRPNIRILLLMDVGGSMDPWAELVSRLFSAAKRATHFKDLQCYYFHNCVYGRLYRTERFDEPVPLPQVLADCGRHYKLVMVGDALMAPWELRMAGEYTELGDDKMLSGVAWLARLAAHFDRSAWLNPEPPAHWSGTTIAEVQRVFAMYPLTLEGLGEAVHHLVRGPVRRV